MRIDVMGVGFDSLTMDEAVARARDLMAERRAAYVVTPNPEIVMLCREDPAAMQAVQGADLVLPDGIGVIYGAKILGTPLRAKLPGIDFASALMAQMGQEGKSVFLLGAKPGVADAAAEKMRARFPGLVIAGTNDGYFQDDDPVVEKSTPRSRICCSCASARRSRNSGCSATRRVCASASWLVSAAVWTCSPAMSSARRSFPEARARVVLPAPQGTEAHRPHDEAAEIPVCGHRLQAPGEETPWRRVN